MPNWKKVITSGSDAAFNSVIASNGFTGSLQGTASYFAETDPIFTAKSASLATTGSNTFTGIQIITGSNGRLIYKGTTPAEVTATLAEIHINDDLPWLHRFYNDTFSTSSAVMAYFGHDDGRFVFHNESTQSIGLQVNGFGAENGLLVYEDKVAFVNNVEVTGSLNVVGGITGSLFGTGSWARNAVTASYITGSIFTSANPVLSASFATTASHALNVSPPVIINNNTDNFIVTATGTSLTVQGEPNFRFDGSLLQLTGSAIISGANASLIVSGTVSATNGFTGNLTGTSSWATVSRRVLMGVVGTLPSGSGETIYYLPVTRNLPIGSNEATLLAQTSSLIYSGSLDLLYVTASWAYTASRAITASFALTTNIATASYVNTLTQDVIISGSISTRISSTDLQNLSAAANSYNGNTVQGTAGSVGIGDLCYLDFTTPSWETVDQTTDSSTKLLGICVDADTGHFLLDGKFTLIDSVIGGTLRRGYPVYLSGTGQFTTDVASLTTGYVRIVGHLLDTNGSGNWLLNFRPDHTWIQL